MLTQIPLTNSELSMSDGESCRDKPPKCFMTPIKLCVILFWMLHFTCVFSFRNKWRDIKYSTMLSIWGHSFRSLTDLKMTRLNWSDLLLKLIFLNFYFRDHKSVRIWDSSNPLAEEYVRVCAFSQRVQYAYRDSSDSFYNCKNFSHIMLNSALSQATQLLFNDICDDKKFW